MEGAEDRLSVPDRCDIVRIVEFVDAQVALAFFVSAS
jgi:hypothetical protein